MMGVEVTIVPDLNINILLGRQNYKNVINITNILKSKNYNLQLICCANLN